MAIIDTTNCTRAYLAKAQSLAGNFNSEIADFRDMPMGSVQIVWSGVTGAFTGYIKLYASNLPSAAAFDGCEIDGAILALDAASGSRIWIRDRLAFRYLQARFEAIGITGGTIDIIALGKKS